MAARSGSLLPMPAFLDDSFPLPLDAPFTSIAARDVGISANALQGLVREGFVRSLAKNVYVAAQVPDSRVLRGHALALVAPPYSVLCDWTACWYWTGIDLPGRHQRVEIDAFRFRGYDRLRNGLARSGQRWFLAEDVVPLAEGLFVSTPIRTAWDLGRFYKPVVAMGGMDALLRHRSFTVDELVGGVERFKRQRGVVLLRWLAPRVDPVSESPGESALRVRWHEAPGLPWPRCQIPILNGEGIELFRVDIGDEELLFAAEYDGEEFHGPERQSHDRDRRWALSDEFGWHIEAFRRPSVYGQQHDASPRLALAWREARKSYSRRVKTRQLGPHAG